MPRVARKRFFAAAALLWLAVLWLALETGALAVRVVQERGNPLIEAYRLGQPPPELRPIDDPASLLAPAPPMEISSARQSPAQACAALGFEPGMDQAAFRAAYRMRFAGMTPAERDASARLASELVLEFDAGLRLRAHYGDPVAGGLLTLPFDSAAGAIARRLFFRSLDGVAAAALRRAAAGEPQPDLAVTLPHAAKPDTVLHVALPPALPGGSVFAFVDIRSDRRLGPPVPPQPADSRWDVPYFRYRCNYPMRPPDPFESNALGWRDGEVRVPKPPGLFRIVCIGSSTTEEGTSTATTYPNLLEARLREALPGTAIEVVNAGVSGLNSTTHLGRADDYAALEPDLAIIYEGINDLTMTSPLGSPWAYPLWMHAARRSGFLFDWIPALTMPGPKRMQRDLEDIFARNLALLAARMRCAGAEVAFCTFAYPAPHRLTAHERMYFDRMARGPTGVSYDAYIAHIGMANAIIRRLCADNGYLAIPVAERLDGGREVFGDICHMMPPGIEAKAIAVADALIPWLRQRVGPGEAS